MSHDEEKSKLLRVKSVESLFYGSGIGGGSHHIHINTVQYCSDDYLLQGYARPRQRGGGGGGPYTQQRGGGGGGRAGQGSIDQPQDSHIYCSY